MQGNIFFPFRGETSYRTVLKITDENSHSYEMYMIEKDGTKFLTMKTAYTKKSKG
ncbi:MAG: DUF1579 domain-containing protein [Candidatus Scalindua sp. AMX11]|nr:MAG: DUF1579 domain-containing protein [Candidatus Scalindua sp.]NOG85150.1 DUF1579 family protein [Planctomycetota bacterium]RZV67646.1 MAG: DUF1579 domain-containing protein [Candidatus Scalindua sp. SCAELEC01]TDE63699.1 MAG: DUF1579 domain-containing protein [Candidatus Scalindua sp. AMX11]